MRIKNLLIIFILITIAITIAITIHNITQQNTTIQQNTTTIEGILKTIKQINNHTYKIAIGNYTGILNFTNTNPDNMNRHETYRLTIKNNEVIKITPIEKTNMEKNKK